jgi:capsular polysaccharide biosynthesis protein
VTEKAVPPLAKVTNDPEAPFGVVAIEAHQQGKDGRGAARVGPLAAAGRHPWLVALPILLIAIPGLIWGVARTPTYKSQAALMVGDVNVSAQSVPGYVLATQQLAGTYARLVESSLVVDQVANELKLPASDVAGQLSASAIAESSELVIEATANDPATADQLAGAAVKALTSQVSATQQNSDRVSSLLEQFNAASTAAGTANLQVQQLTKSISAAAPGSAALASLQNQLVQKQTELDAANLNAQALGQQYQQAVSDSTTAPGSIQTIQEPSSQGSDFQSKIQLVIAAALLLGGVIGLALATWASNRRA